MLLTALAPPPRTLAARSGEQAISIRRILRFQRPGNAQQWRHVTTRGGEGRQAREFQPPGWSLPVCHIRIRRPCMGGRMAFSRARAPTRRVPRRPDRSWIASRGRMHTDAQAQGAGLAYKWNGTGPPCEQSTSSREEIHTPTLQAPEV